MQMNLFENIKIFIEIVDAGSFAQAAENLQIHRPAVTKALQQLEQESGFRLEVGAEPGGNALAEALKGVPGVSSVEENGETFLVQSATDVSDAVAQALLAQKFHLTYLRQCGSDLDEIYSRYFVKAGEQNEGSRSGRIFRHRKGEAQA